MSIRVNINRNNILDFTPNTEAAMVGNCSALTLVKRAIIEGSGGPENVTMTKAGLYFVRFLLFALEKERYGGMPNFKNAQSIEILAKWFIQYSGGNEQALQIMDKTMLEAVFAPT